MTQVPLERVQPVALTVPLAGGAVTVIGALVAIDCQVPLLYKTNSYCPAVNCVNVNVAPERPDVGGLAQLLVPSRNLLCGAVLPDPTKWSPTQSVALPGSFAIVTVLEAPTMSVVGVALIVGGSGVQVKFSLRVKFPGLPTNVESVYAVFGIIGYT